MADGHRVDPRDDDAEQNALASEARLVRRVRWRLVVWSGLSTLIVLVGLAVALYAAVANTLAAASIDQLSNRIDPWVAALEGTTDVPVRPPGFGFQPGRGNTFLFAFDAAGTPVRLAASRSPSWMACPTPLRLPPPPWRRTGPTSARRRLRSRPRRRCRSPSG